MRGLLLFVLVTSVWGESPEICVDLCLCNYVTQDVRGELRLELAYVPNQVRNDFYIYVNCSAEDTVGDLRNLEWPKNHTFGIFADFGRSQWRTMEKLPENIQNNIIKLFISKNLVSKIDFDDFPRLIEVDLSRNKLEIINKTTFVRLKHLHTLYLAGNVIESIESEAFTRNNELRHLDLSYNKIKTLQFGIFEGLKNLVSLDLSFNRIKQLPMTFSTELEGLINLYLRNNEIVELSQLPEYVQYLDLSFNELADAAVLSTTLKQLTHLRNVHIGSNRLRELLIQDFPNLEILIASSNFISSIPVATNLNLKILDLSDNQLPSYPEVLTGANLPLLEQVYLDGNSISSIQVPPSMIPFQKLRVINLSRLVGLESIDETALRMLTAPPAAAMVEDSLHSTITTADPVFSQYLLSKMLTNCSLPGLMLNLSHNDLSHIHPRAFKGLILCSVDLSDNNLQTLADGLLSWDRLSFVDLQRNPWQCDCGIQWILDHIMPQLYKQQQILLNDLKCAAPRRYEGRNFVTWYGKTDGVFCSTPSAVYFRTQDGKLYEFWTASLIACVVLSVIICILLIAIITLLCMRLRRRGRTRKVSVQRRRSRDAPYYKEIRQTIDNPKTQV